MIIEYLLIMESRLIKEIREIKKQISLLEDYVTVDDSGYSYISTDGDDTKHDAINRDLLNDLNTAAKEAGVRPVITTAKSGHSTRTIHGTISRHSHNDAVDIAIINGKSAEGATSSSDGNADFRRLGDKLKDELVKLGYVWNKSERGNDKVVLWQTNQGGNHYNHLHVSNVGDGESTDSSDDPTDLSKREKYTQPDPKTDLSKREKYSQPDAKTNLNLVFKAFKKFL